MSIRKETLEKDRKRLITGMSDKEIEVLILIILEVFIVYSIYKLF